MTLQETMFPTDQFVEGGHYGVDIPELRLPQTSRCVTEALGRPTGWDPMPWKEMKSQCATLWFSLVPKITLWCTVYVFA